MSKPIDHTEAVRQIVVQLTEGDWDDVLRIYRAAVDPKAKLAKQSDGSFLIQLP